MTRQCIRAYADKLMARAIAATDGYPADLNGRRTTPKGERIPQQEAWDAYGEQQVQKLRDVQDRYERCHPDCRQCGGATVG